MCCHVQKIRSPGLLLTYSQMCNVYLPGCTGMSDPTATLLDYISQLKDIATVGIVGSACLDDTTVMTPQRAIVQAISAAPIAGILIQTYTNLIINTVTLFTCLDGLSSRCNVNGTLTVAQAPVPDTGFPDTGLELLCSEASLQAFDLSRFATPCAPPNIPT